MTDAHARADAASWEITPVTAGPLRTLAETWTHRRMLGFLAVRSLRKIYRRTLLGWLWLFIIPLFPLTLRALVFGGLLGVTSEGIPYFLFLMIGQLVWDFFAMGLTWGTRGLELHGGIQDVYVPRVIMPLGSMAAAFVDLLIKTSVLALTIVYFAYRDSRAYVVFGPQMLLAAAAVGLTWLFAVGLTLFTSVWSEETRDTRFTLAQVISVWYLLTPVLYPLSSVPEEWRAWVALNPLATLIATFKYGLLGIGEPGPALVPTAAGIGLFFLAGLWYFARRDAEVIEAR